MTQKTQKETLEQLERIAAEPPLSLTPVPIVMESAITPDGLRAARGLLDWSRDDLRLKSGVSNETIKNIENGVFKPKKETHEKLTKTLAENGVEFVWVNSLARYGLNVTGVLRVEVKKEEQA